MPLCALFGLMILSDLKIPSGIFSSPFSSFSNCSSSVFKSSISFCNLSRKNKHLNDFERGQIQLLHNKGYSAYRIAKELRRASNTIRNELKRGTVTQIKGIHDVQVYYPDTGKLVYEKNRKNCKKKLMI